MIEYIVLCLGLGIVLGLAMYTSYKHGQSDLIGVMVKNGYVKYRKGPDGKPVLMKIRDALPSPVKINTGVRRVKVTS